MKYITKRSSETGKKFQEIENKAKLILLQDRKIAIEIGFTEWRGGYNCVYGGFSSLIFKKTPNTKIFKKVYGNEWMPKLNVKEGKEIKARLDSSLTVTKNDLNQCIGFDGAPFKTIGFAQNNKEYFGFVVDEDWDVKIPEDCEEVTVTRYNELFKR